MSPEAQDLIRKCLVVDPGQRIAIQDFMQHAWIVNASTKTTPLNAPAALRTMEGRQDMKEFFNFGLHADRDRVDGGDAMEAQLADQKSTIKLANISQSKILKKRHKEDKGA